MNKTSSQTQKCKHKWKLMSLSKVCEKCGETRHYTRKTAGEKGSTKTTKINQAVSESASLESLRKIARPKGIKYINTYSKSQLVEKIRNS